MPPSVSLYLLLVCSGRQCLPLLTLPPVVVSEADARSLMRQLATRLREKGGLECLSRPGEGWYTRRMSKAPVSDDLWAIAAPLLPPEPPKPKGGRPRVPDRACLTGILFVLTTGIPWSLLPQEMGGGSGVTCWRRPRDWHRAGVRDQLHRPLLDRLGAADRIDGSRASLDSASVPAKRGASGPAPTRPTAANRAPTTTS